MYGGLLSPPPPQPWDVSNPLLTCAPLCSQFPSKSVDAQIRVNKAEKDLIAIRAQYRNF